VFYWAKPAEVLGELAGKNQLF
jgi:hypothetical protein